MGNLALPYVPIDPHIDSHPKTLRFLRALGKIDDPVAHMHLIAFLLAVGRHHVDGRLGVMDDVEIAYMGLWRDDAKKFTEALVSSGWLMIGEGGYVVVGWEDYGGMVLAKREAWKEKQKENGKLGGRPKKPQNNPNVTQNNPDEPKPLFSKPKKPEGEGEGEGEGEEERKKEKPLASSAARSQPQTAVALRPAEVVALQPTGPSLPLNTGEDYPIANGDIEEWRLAFPSVDVPQQLREMRAWCLANPTKRKTKSGVKAFVVRWLSKEQNKGPPRAAAQRALTRAVSWQDKSFEEAIAGVEAFNATRG